MSQGMDDEQDQLNLMNNASPEIQQVFGPKDDKDKQKNNMEPYGIWRNAFSRFL